ncbi:hypothetical protein BJ875DRAFT_206123 [Amylocarpus encephaloides]|uniref:Uncharacterized protein n=1 Tax=Amylocarpus encephaloides TaxID=45428 RepID=A0A9P7Y9M9_9HELO|nr:hypothetical protein BJ875DRAFT_206123 [Amylocarpus encephaloides]
MGFTKRLNDGLHVPLTRDQAQVPFSNSIDSGHTHPSPIDQHSIFRAPGGPRTENIRRREPQIPLELEYQSAETIGLPRDWKYRRQVTQSDPVCGEQVHVDGTNASSQQLDKATTDRLIDLAEANSVMNLTLKGIRICFDNMDQDRQMFQSRILELTQKCKTLSLSLSAVLAAPQPIEACDSTDEYNRLRVMDGRNTSAVPCKNRCLEPPGEIVAFNVVGNEQSCASTPQVLLHPEQDEKDKEIQLLEAIVRTLSTRLYRAASLQKVNEPESNRIKQERDELEVMNRELQHQVNAQDILRDQLHVAAANLEEDHIECLKRVRRLDIKRTLLEMMIKRKDEDLKNKKQTVKEMSDAIVERDKEIIIKRDEVIAKTIEFQQLKSFVHGAFDDLLETADSQSPPKQQKTHRAASECRVNPDSRLSEDSTSTVIRREICGSETSGSEESMESDSPLDSSQMWQVKGKGKEN